MLTKTNKKNHHKTDKVQQIRKQARIKDSVESGVSLYDADADTKDIEKGPLGWGR